MKISFVCPIYNKKKYLPLVINSIKNQLGDFDSEFIFIDDGSNDGSMEIVKKNTFKWKNVFYLSHANKGPAFSTQQGILKSKGDYLKLVGGDDILIPNCVDLLIKAIKKNNSVAVFSCYELREKIGSSKFKKETTLLNYRVLTKPLEKTLISCFSGTSPNLYCNKSVKKSGGCYTNLFVEDFSLVLRLSKYGNFSFINNLTSIGPLNDDNRIMIGNESQMVHDYNATIYYFLKENKIINKNLLKKICKKCLGRTDKWVRRNKNIYLNKMFFYRILFYLFPFNEIELIRKSCSYFYNLDLKKKIRYELE